MLSPKEKAREMFYKYCDILFPGEQFISQSKPQNCAIAEVDGIIESHMGQEWIVDSRNLTNSEYWQLVKEALTTLTFK